MDRTYSLPEILHRLRLIRMGRDACCYLSGPMTGLPEFNVQAFRVCTEFLRSSGWKVWSPHENDAEAGVILEGKSGDEVWTEQGLEGFSFKAAMANDLWQVCSADAVFVMPGWEYSTGAEIEVWVAHRVGVPVYSFLSGRQIEAPEVAPHEFSSRPVAEEQADRADGAMLNFSTGATRNRKEDEIAYEGFLSPLAIRMYGEYMHKHRFTTDGNVRDPDNWQKGIPRESYMDSMWRHMMDLQLIHDGYPELARESLSDALSGLYFNVQGYMHEAAKDELEQQRQAA